MHVLMLYSVSPDLTPGLISTFIVTIMYKKKLHASVKITQIIHFGKRMDWIKFNLQQTLNYP